MEDQRMVNGTYYLCKINWGVWCFRSTTKTVYLTCVRPYRRHNADDIWCLLLALPVHISVTTIIPQLQLLLYNTSFE